MRSNKRNKVSEKDLEFVSGKGSKDLLGEFGGSYWHIYLKQKRVGRVFIALTKREDSKELQPFITVELNQKNRGIGIGTLAFRIASELSNYDKVYAEMRKNNLASSIAATRAGFVPDKSYTGNQLRLVWTKS